MEDAHIAAVNLGNDKNTAMFGVFDGHGGRRVSSMKTIVVDLCIAAVMAASLCWTLAVCPGSRRVLWVLHNS